MKQACGRDVSSVNLSGEFVSCMANTYWVFLCKIVTLKVCGPPISGYFVFLLFYDLWLFTALFGQKLPLAGEPFKDLCAFGLSSSTSPLSS